MGWIFDLQLRIRGRDISVTVVHQVLFFIVIVAAEKAVIVKVGLRLSMLFLFGVELHRFKY
jgi:hypothetical protein